MNLHTDQPPRRKSALMVRVASAALITLAALSPPASQATLIFKTGVIDELQIESHERVGREDVIWLRLNGSWGAVNCLTDWGWFNSKTSPQLLAAALTARATGATVKVYVDDGMPKVDGYCQITIMTM
jgi:hypothetical protein